MFDFRLKSTFNLLLSPLISLILVGCNVPDGHSNSSDIAGLDLPVELEVTRKTQTSVSTKNDIKLEHFKPIIEGNIAAHAAALGGGPYKIGHSPTGYPSDSIKEAFDAYYELYTNDTLFEETFNNQSDVCNFVKVVLFSDEINLNDFYWPHPEAKLVPVQRVRNSSHTYWVKDTLYTFHFGYHDYRVDRLLDRRGLHKSFNNPIFHFCAFLGASYEYRTNIPGEIRQGLGSCSSEYALQGVEDPKEEMIIFPEAVPGSTIGFFIYEGEPYIVSLRLFEFSPYGYGYGYVAHREIKVTRVKLPENRMSPENIKQVTLEPVCRYQRLRSTEQ